MVNIHESYWTTNRHGVAGYFDSTGAHYGRRNSETGRIETHRPVFVPKICTSCPNFDEGEYGDYGSKLSPPYCTANVWFPTSTGRCKRGERDGARAS